MLKPASRTRITLGGLALTTLALASNPIRTSLAWADTPSAEAVAETRRGDAKQKFEAGVQAFGERRYQDAVRLFQQADAEEPSAALSFNIARAFERLNDPSAALRWYRDYLRRNPQATNLVQVQNRVLELAGALAARGVQQLTVLSAPTGAEVLVDNQLVGHTPATLELAPGPHHVELRRAGFADARADFTLDPRIPQDLTLRLTPSNGAPVQSSPGPSPRPAPASSPKAQRPFGVTPYVVTGAGAVSMLAALGFELGRRSAESAAERATQLEYQEHYDSMHGRATAARVFVGVGAALLLTGGTLWLLNAPRSATPGLSLSCGGTGCGLAARGTFQ